MRDHKTLAVTTAAYLTVTKLAKERCTDRKAIASKAILALVAAEPQHGKSQLCIAAALIAGIALGWLATGILS